MIKKDYKKIQKINLSVTKKLLDYISEEIKKPNIVEEVKFLGDDFFTHNISFDLWLSFDFLNSKGQSFIDRFLLDYRDKLTEDEKSILLERKRSNISLFEVIEIKGEYILVLDLLQNIQRTIWEPELSAITNVEDLIFSRYANILGLNTFVGNISYLPKSVRNSFLKEIFLDFNNLREKDTSLSIKDYLKTYSINVYTIYTRSVFEAIEMESDISSIFYDELEEFQGYLSIKVSKREANVIMSNLIDFFEYYLADDEISLLNIDDLDLDRFFHCAINDGFIISAESLNSYIQTFKLYLGFISNIDSKYKKSYDNILNISKKRFYFMELLKTVKIPFEVDANLSKEIKKNLNHFYNIPIIDFDKFMLYMLNKPLDLTATHKKIKRNHLIDINNMMDLSYEVKKKNPNQSDFKIIEMYYNMSLHLELAEIKGNKFICTNKGSNYLRLREEEKYTVFFQYIWSKDFIDTIYPIESEKRLGKYKKDLLNFLSSLEKNKKYEMLKVFPKASIDSDFFLNYYEYLKYIGIIDYSLYPNYEISITQLGKSIVNYLLWKNKPSSKARIIEINSLRKDIY